MTIKIKFWFPLFKCPKKINKLLMFFYLLGLSLSSQFPADFLFRMHDHDGWFGPKTLFDGYSGHLLRIPDDVNLENFFSKPRSRPEVLVIPMALLTVTDLDKIISLYKPRPYLQGFIVIPNDTLVISPDVPFPNKQYSSYQPPEDFKWNPVATSMVTQKYEFPIVYPPQSEVKNLIEHMKYYGSKAGVYLRIYMLSRGNSKRCLKDESCQFLGGLTLYGSFGKDYGSVNEKQKAVWAIASYDSYGLFPYAHVGADYSISGFITLLGAIESFKDIDWTKAKRPLRFAFFDGEEVGYLGSTKFLRDVTEPFNCQKRDGNTCLQPYRLDFGFESVSPDDFGTVIEVKSVAKAKNLYVHTNRNGKGLNISLPATDSTLSVEMADQSLPGIPPSSVNTFIKKFPDIEHAVLTSYKGKFPTDNRYGSPSDVEYNSDDITKASQTLVKILYDLCGIDSGNPVPTVNKTIISELMKGFVTNPSSSDYMQSLFPNSRLPTDHVSLYSGPYNEYTLDLKQLVVKEVLADTLATANNVTSIKCTSNDQCSNLGLACSSKLGVCINYTMNMHPAYSDAFEWDEDKWEMKVVNESKALPFECEANWDSPDLQYITLPALWTGRITAGIGILLWVVLAILLNIFWNYNLNFLQK